MSEKALFFIIVAINVVLYILAFGFACIKKQSMAFYTTLLVVEFVLLLFCIVEKIRSGGVNSSDAAGMGMIEGFFWLSIGAILIIFILILAVTIVVRLKQVG